MKKEAADYQSIKNDERLWEEELQQARNLIMGQKTSIFFARISRNHYFSPQCDLDYADIKESKKLEWELIDQFSSDVIAERRNSFNLYIARNSKGKTVVGRDVTILTKQPDGTWNIDKWPFQVFINNRHRFVQFDDFDFFQDSYKVYFGCIWEALKEFEEDKA